MFSELCQDLQKITQNHKRIMSMMLQPYDLTYAQYLVLYTVFEKDQILATELITLLASDKATISTIIKRLERSGWLAKVENPKDKRKQHLTLTYDGRDKMHAIGNLEDECERSLAHSFPLKDQKKLQQNLRELIANQHQFLQEKR